MVINICTVLLLRKLADGSKNVSFEPILGRGKKKNGGRYGGVVVKWAVVDKVPGSWWLFCDMLSGLDLTQLQVDRKARKEASESLGRLTADKVEFLPALPALTPIILWTDL
jgi:hypothetical protein